MMYNELVEDCFFSAQHVGHLDAAMKNTICYQSKLPGMGGAIELSLQCEDEGIVQSACFRAHGNPYLVASLEWLCRQMEGESIHLHPSIDYQSLVERFDMPNTQYPIAIRVEDVYREAVSEMQKKLNEVKS